MDTREALLRRIELAPPEARTHGDKYEVVLLGLAALFGEEIAGEVRGRVPAVRPGTFNCATRELLHLCDVAACFLEEKRGCPYARVLEQLGLFTIRSFFKSPLGKGLWMFSSRDIHESLNRSLGSLRSVYTHGLRRFEKRGPHGAALIFREELMGPAWMHGIYQGGLEILPQPVRFSVEEVTAPGASFTLNFTW